MSVAIAATIPQGPAAANLAEKKPSAPGHSELSFGDLLDVINPLQHIPFIGTIYRRMTGDSMSPTAEIAGGALYGGIVGTIASIADVIFTQETGKDFGETVFAWLGLKDKAETQIAAAGAARPVPFATPVSPSRGPAVQPIALGATPPRAALAPVRPVRPQGTTAGTAVPGLPSLIGAMQKQGVDPTIAARAALAYRSAIGWKSELNAPPIPAH